MSSENLHEGETRKSADDDIIEYVLLNDNNNNMHDYGRLIIPRVML